MSSLPHRFSAPGPFRADQIREGDAYELSNGHPIACMGAGGRHSTSNSEGAKVLSTDPGDEPTGVDAGFAFNDGKNLRAPDIAVGNLENKPGWAQGVPGLAVEYADRGQDEAQLQEKIAELIDHGTQFVWVVRLTGPLRVEVHRPGKRTETVDADGELTAPGILKNPVPVRALVDRDVANEATLRNLLQRKGYADLDAVRAEGLRAALQDLCEVLEIPLSARRRTQIERMSLEDLKVLRTHLKKYRAWPR